jgi:hypothetical protein
MLAFVIGPSGAGKTTLLGRARLALPIEVLDLDKEDLTSEWLVGWGDRRWERDSPRLAAAEERSRNHGVVADVGAGSLQSLNGRNYFRQRSAQTICVFAPPEIVLERKHPTRDPAELRDTEYSTERFALYNAAALWVDSTKAVEQAAADLVSAIRTALRLG